MQIAFGMAQNTHPLQAVNRMTISTVDFDVGGLLVQPAGAAGAPVVHTQQRAAAAAASAEVVAIPTGPGVRAVTPASTVVSPTLSPVQSQTRPLNPVTGI